MDNSTCNQEERLSVCLSDWKVVANFLGNGFLPDSEKRVVVTPQNWLYTEENFSLSLERWCFKHCCCCCCKHLLPSMTADTPSLAWQLLIHEHDDRIDSWQKLAIIMKKTSQPASQLQCPEEAENNWVIFTTSVESTFQSKCYYFLGTFNCFFASLDCVCLKLVPY